MDVYELLSRLDGEMQNTLYKIRQTQESESRKDVLEKIINEHKTTLITINQLLTETSRIVKPLKEYNATKQERALEGIHAGILSVRSIVTDAFPVKLEINNETAYLVNDKGDDINRIEGSAFRAMSSFFMRDVILSNTEYLQFEILDEPLTTLSENNSAEFSNYLGLLARNKQKILIEHKDSVFVNSDVSDVFAFKKSEGKTTITKL